MVYGVRVYSSGPFIAVLLGNTHARTGAHTCLPDGLVMYSRCVSAWSGPATAVVRFSAKGSAWGIAGSNPGCASTRRLVKTLAGVGGRSLFDLSSPGTLTLPTCPQPVREPALQFHLAAWPRRDAWDILTSSQESGMVSLCFACSVWSRVSRPSGVSTCGCLPPDQRGRHCKQICQKPANEGGLVFPVVFLFSIPFH